MRAPRAASFKVKIFNCRTKDRPLATGEISKKSALILFGSLLLIACYLALQLNIFTLKLAALGALIATIYPFTKRFTHLPQVVLGVAFGGWPILMGFAGITNSLPPLAWALFFPATLWPIAYDTMYAMVDREEDLKIGVKSTAILFGNADRFIIALLQTLIILGFINLGKMLALSTTYYLGLTAVAALFIYQQVLIKDHNKENCFKAFLNNNWVGLLVMLSILEITSYSATGL